MKFMIGFLAGVAVGSFLATNSTAEQRAKAAVAASKATRRVQESTVGRAVTTNAAQVSDAASERVADAVNTAGDTVTDAISADAV